MVRESSRQSLVLPIPGAKNGRQAAENAGALAFSLSLTEIEALDRATAAWRGDTKGATS
jgi:diketogulonate reductase-like aldo/keto reductase